MHVHCAGRHFGHYVAGLVLVGFGWALAYVAASSLVAYIFVHQPHVRVAVQGGMDVLVLGLLAVANAASAPMVKVSCYLKLYPANASSLKLAEVIYCAS